MNGLERLIREIHRRSLWQVLGIYAVASWVVLQVVETLGGIVTLPEWFGGVALGLLIVGLPIVLATAFVQEGASGVGGEESFGRESPEIDGTDFASGSAASRLFTWRNALLGGVGAFALLGFVGMGWVLSGGGIGSGEGDAEASNAAEQSVAVLPFQNMSADADNEYFSDGITEELLNALAQIPDLRVPGRTSSFAFKDQNFTIQQIADTLDVDHVLEGSVRRADDRVLITAQLVDARTDSHLWSETYERQLEDVFAIQREIAGAIVGQLEVRLAGSENMDFVPDATRSVEAHEAYLRGRYLWNQRSAATMPQSIDAFERATTLDPEFAEAWSGLADAWIIHLLFEGAADVPAVQRRALQAATRAVELKPALGMARASRGHVLFSMGHWEESEAEYRRAVELKPGYATGHQWLGEFLAWTGRAEEGILHLRRAIDLDPVSRIAHSDLAIAHVLAGNLPEAIEYERRALELDPDWSAGLNFLARFLLLAGEYQEARRVHARWVEASGVDPSLAEELLDAWIAYHSAGERVELSAALVRWVEEGPGPAGVYAYLGRREKALEWLEHYVHSGDQRRVALAGSHPRWDFLEDDPRYRELMDEAGVTW